MLKQKEFFYIHFPDRYINNLKTEYKIIYLSQKKLLKDTTFKDLDQINQFLSFFKIPTQIRITKNNISKYITKNQYDYDDFTIYTFNYKLIKFLQKPIEETLKKNILIINGFEPIKENIKKSYQNNNYEDYFKYIDEYIDYLNELFINNNISNNDAYHSIESLDSIVFKIGIKWYNKDNKLLEQHKNLLLKRRNIKDKFKENINNYQTPLYFKYDNVQINKLLSNLLSFLQGLLKLQKELYPLVDNFNDYITDWSNKLLKRRIIIK